VDELSYACAAAAISVSRNIVHIGIEIRKQGVLAGPYWFMLYTEFFAVLSLVFYAIENPEKLGSAEVLGDAAAGRDMIANLREKSQAAERVTNSLSVSNQDRQKRSQDDPMLTLGKQVLFEQLPDRLQQIRSRSFTSRKRAAPSKSGSVPFHGQPAGHPGLPQRRSDEHPRPRNDKSNGLMTQASMRSSFDDVRIPDNPFNDPAFSASVQDLLAMEMPSTTPDSTSTGGSSYPRPSGFPPQPMSAAGSHPLRKLDALMFPSEDPFAYPNQPMMELGFQKESSGQLGVSQADSGQFYLPGTFDDIETQLLGEPASYIMQHPERQGLDLAGLYSGPGMTGVRGSQRSHQGRRVSMQQSSQREFEQYLSDTGYQAYWGSMFGRGAF
jgi:hypothetical protein